MSNKCPTFTASDAAPLQYLAPYSGCAMGEYFRCGLIVTQLRLIVVGNILCDKVADPNSLHPDPVFPGPDLEAQNAACCIKKREKKRRIYNRF
jgi:hypothetical protein